MPPLSARTAAQRLCTLSGGDVLATAHTLHRALRPSGVVAYARGDQQEISALGPAGSGQSFEIASVTKPFTAALAFALSRAGRLHLDRPLSRQLELFGGYPASVTARALLTHTAGLPVHPLRSNLEMLRQFHDPYGPLSARDVLASGRRWAWLGRGRAGQVAYSNLGYGLLALALSQAAGEPYPAALVRWVTQPLGLRHTGFEPRAPLALPRGALGSHKVSGFGGLLGAGGLYSTAHDLLRFALAHLHGLLDDWQQVWTPRHLPPELVGVAGGWFVGRWPAPVWWHDGVARGTRSGVAFCPHTGTAAVVLIASGVPLSGQKFGPLAVLRQVLQA